MYFSSLIYKMEEIITVPTSIGHARIKINHVQETPGAWYLIKKLQLILEWAKSALFLKLYSCAWNASAGCIQSNSENLILLQMLCFPSVTEWILMLNERGGGEMPSISINSILFNCKTIYLIWTSKILSLNIFIYSEYSWVLSATLSSAVCLMLFLCLVSLIWLLANIYCLLCTRHWGVLHRFI